MNSRKDLAVDGTHLDVPRRNSLSPEVERAHSARSREETPIRRSADLPADRLSPEIIAEFRRRIARGVYDAPASVHELAVRLLESGDV